ncbi:hypothetical protein [Pelosinus fermentans]|uniref:Uncharacterized protein n=1 Tax=Pelosinus fermentans JBW45 TaxID=1192197 RepID=I9NP54_9FIRM|nr:hypothetical protein [Pelosinus fermentans]AJQ26082.1 hypothetical protein JBW_00730 [Pelosinus fermentans JBW45]
MHQENIGLLFIKHCSNFQRLSAEQLRAIEEEQYNMVTELAAQKQIIMNSMIELQGQFDINNCQQDIKEKVSNLLHQITVSESQSQQIIKERSTDISKKMLANRKEMNIQQAYEESSFPDQGNLCNIEK